MSFPCRSRTRWKGWRTSIANIPRMNRRLVACVLLMLPISCRDSNQVMLTVYDHTRGNVAFRLTSHRGAPKIVTILVYNEQTRRFMWVVHSHDYAIAEVPRSRRELLESMHRGATLSTFEYAVVPLGFVQTYPAEPLLPPRLSRGTTYGITLIGDSSAHATFTKK